MFILSPKRRSFHGILSALAVALLVPFLAIAPGCGLPGTSSKDEGLKVEHSYRESNPACTNLDLESSSLTPASLRGLTACLNTRGHIQEFSVRFALQTVEHITSN